MEEKWKVHRTASRDEGSVVDDEIDRQAHNLSNVNHALGQIGFGRYQWQLFCTCGFGFLLDQMLPVAMSLVLPQVTKQWHIVHSELIVLALYAGSLVGALVCGFAVDLIGRKTVWQVSLLAVTVFTLVSASSPNFPTLCVFVALQGLTAGGNFAIDLTVFIESLPKSKDYLLTALPLWWGLGNALGGLLAWPLIGTYSCPEGSTPQTCSNSENMGWRYQYILVGGLALLSALVRIFLMKMEESPKWLVATGKFDEAVEVLGHIARTNKSDFTIVANDFFPLSTEGLEGTHSPPKFTVLSKVKDLFSSRKLAISTVGVISLWVCIGIAYPVYTMYLPIYLENNGANTGSGSTYQTYRDYAITSTVGIFGPILATVLVNIPLLGRRRAMALTALIAAAFCGGFTTVRTEASNLAFSSMISFWQNAFYAILYSYTPEVMPTALRGTGCGLTLASGRIASMSAPIIAIYGNLNTPVPIWVLVGVYGLIALVSICLPFEPKQFSEDERY